MPKCVNVLYKAGQRVYSCRVVPPPACCTVGDILGIDKLASLRKAGSEAVTCFLEFVASHYRKQIALDFRVDDLPTSMFVLRFVETLRGGSVMSNEESEQAGKRQEATALPAYQEQSGYRFFDAKADSFEGKAELVSFLYNTGWDLEHKAQPIKHCRLVTFRRFSVPQEHFSAIPAEYNVELIRPRMRPDVEILAVLDCYFTHQIGAELLYDGADSLPQRVTQPGQICLVCYNAAFAVLFFHLLPGQSACKLALPVLDDDYSFVAATSTATDGFSEPESATKKAEMLYEAKSELYTDFPKDFAGDYWKSSIFSKECLDGLKTGKTTCFCAPAQPTLRLCTLNFSGVVCEVLAALPQVCYFMNRIYLRAATLYAADSVFLSACPTCRILCAPAAEVRSRQLESVALSMSFVQAIEKYAERLDLKQILTVLSTEQACSRHLKLQRLRTIFSRASYQTAGYIFLYLQKILLNEALCTLHPLVADCIEAFLGAGRPFSVFTRLLRYIAASGVPDGLTALRLHYYAEDSTLLDMGGQTERKWGEKQGRKGAVARIPSARVVFNDAIRSKRGDKGYEGSVKPKTGAFDDFPSMAGRASDPHLSQRPQSASCPQAHIDSLKNGLPRLVAENACSCVLLEMLDQNSFAPAPGMDEPLAQFLCSNDEFQAVNYSELERFCCFLPVLQALPFFAELAVTPAIFNRKAGNVQFASADALSRLKMLFLDAPVCYRMALAQHNFQQLRGARVSYISAPVIYGRTAVFYAVCDPAECPRDQSTVTPAASEGRGAGWQASIFELHERYQRAFGPCQQKMRYITHCEEQERGLAGDGQREGILALRQLKRRDFGAFTALAGVYMRERLFEAVHGDNLRGGLAQKLAAFEVLRYATQSKKQLFRGRLALADQFSALAAEMTQLHASWSAGDRFSGSLASSCAAEAGNDCGHGLSGGARSEEGVEGAAESETERGGEEAPEPLAWPAGKPINSEIAPDLQRIEGVRCEIHARSLFDLLVREDVEMREFQRAEQLRAQAADAVAEIQRLVLEMLDFLEELQPAQGQRELLLRAAARRERLATHEKYRYKQTLAAKAPPARQRKADGSFYGAAIAGCAAHFAACQAVAGRTRQGLAAARAPSAFDCTRFLSQLLSE